MSDETRTHIRLFVLVILAFLPAVILWAFANRTLRGMEQERQEARLVELARLTSVEYRRLVEESRQLLGSLAEFPAIASATQPECGERLASILDHTPQYTTLSVIGRDGYMTCGSLPADGGELYLGDLAYYLLATTNGRFAVGEYALGRITGKPTVGVAHPIGRGGPGEIQEVLAASLDLTRMGRPGELEALPPATTLTVLDRAGNVLVRRPVPASGDPDTVGARMPESFPALDGDDRSVRLVEGTDLDGVERLFAVAPLLTTGGGSPEGFVLVGKARADLLAEVESAMDQELGVLAVGGLAVLLLTWLYGHYGLVRAARTETDMDPIG